MKNVPKGNFSHPLMCVKNEYDLELETSKVYFRGETNNFVVFTKSHKWHYDVNVV